MEYIALILSAIALIFTLFTYLRHDKKIKQQSKIINDYQLQKINAEIEEDKKADIGINVIRVKNGNRTIKVYNKGKCIARNVEVILPDIDGFSEMINPCPIDIRPQDGIEVLIGAISVRCPETIEITLKWEDNFKHDNIEHRKMQIK